jgi:hypothetical protein
VTPWPLRVFTVVEQLLNPPRSTIAAMKVSKIVRMMDSLIYLLFRIGMAD